MSKERFIKLVEEYNGFEFSQAYRNDVDHFIGGKGNTYWYVITKKGKAIESYIGTLKDGEWNDKYIKGNKPEKDMPSGTTIDRIVEKAYLMQDATWVSGRKNPRLIEDVHPHYHYVYGFGDKALDISEKYGVTIAFSDINNMEAGFHLRTLYTGSDVELP